ncbi:MAG: hypothetical protein QOD98_4365 [Nocardioidaceae bacterium]|nr:hypothetical protein [Nocardioidaceae bacterium]
MTTLHDRLADLAEDAPAARAAPGLWERGVGYRRRRRVGTAVVLAVAAVALVVLGSATWLRSPQAVEPLPAGSPVSMPDRLFTPSPWLPGTDDAGPLGTIAALIPADRGTWTGTKEQQVVGVSATTGEYRFVDLPGLAPYTGASKSFALSPDGKYVAYLYRDDRSEDPGTAATGLALYDATTGEARRHALPGSRGIRGDELIWAGDDTVVLSYGSITDDSGSASVGQPLEAWNVNVDAPQTLPSSGLVSQIRGSGPGFVVVYGRHADRVLDVGTGVVLRTLAHISEGMTEPFFDRDANRFAIVQGNRIPNLMSVGTVGATVADQPTYERVPNSERSFAAYAWIDDDHLALLQRKGAVKDTLDVVVNSVDIRTGQVQSLVSFDGPDVGFDRQLATDLLARPTADAVQPPRPLDPRMVTGGGVTIVLAAIWAMIAWRRRVRP